MSSRRSFERPGRVRAGGARTPAGERVRGPRGLGGDQVEGRRAVRELLAARRRKVRGVWIAEGLDRSRQIDEIEALAAKARVPVSFVGRRRLEAMSRTEAAQGVVAKAAPIEEHSIEDLCAPGSSTFLMVLDGLSDPQNLGSLLRSGECAGVTGTLLPRHRAAHVTPSVTKAAAGAVEHVPIGLVGGIPAALSRLSDEGVFTVGLDATASASIFELGGELEGPVALVLGGEGRGLASLTKRRCDRLASIPMFGSTGSLNVAVAGAVACFEVARRRSAASNPQSVSDR